MFKFGLRRVVGHSMAPGLVENDLILIKKTDKYKIGNIVGFKHKDKILIKRISGINNGKYYLLGDNKYSSLDSRKLGWIDKDQIVFKMIFKF